MEVPLQHLLADADRLGGAEAGVDAQIAQRAVEPVDMLLQAEGLVLEGAGGVEDRIAEQEAAIAKRQQHLALGQDLTVEIGDAFVLSNAHGSFSAIAIWPGSPAPADRYEARPPAA